MWKSGGFGLGRRDLGMVLPKKILEICVRQFVGFGYMEIVREKFNIINIFIDFIVYTIKSINLFP